MTDPAIVPAKPAEQTPRTIVIFREERILGSRPAEWQVVAIFPELPGTNDPGTCTCYAHVGQHGSMDTSYRFQTRKPRDLAAVAALRAELEGLGYVIEERTRLTRAMDDARRAALVRS